MQSKNQVVILGISIFDKPEQTVQSNRSAGVRKKRLPSCLDVKLYSLLLQCSGHVQSKSGIDLVEVSIFNKSEKASGQTVWPIKIKTVAFFYLIMAA